MSRDTSVALNVMGDEQIDLNRASEGPSGYPIKPRLAWVDSVRGMALIRDRLLNLRDHFYDTSIRSAATELVVSTFALFRMPATTVLSGMFVPRPLATGPATYVGGKLRTNRVLVRIHYPIEVE